MAGPRWRIPTPTYLGLTHAPSTASSGHVPLLRPTRYPPPLAPHRPPPLQVTCFEQAAPHGGVLCSEGFRDALLSPRSSAGLPAASRGGGRPSTEARRSSGGWKSPRLSIATNQLHSLDYGSRAIKSQVMNGRHGFC